MLTSNSMRNPEYQVILTSPTLITIYLCTSSPLSSCPPPPQFRKTYHRALNFPIHNQQISLHPQTFSKNPHHLLALSELRAYPEHIASAAASKENYSFSHFLHNTMFELGWCPFLSSLTMATIFLPTLLQENTWIMLLVLFATFI